MSPLARLFPFCCWCAIPFLEAPAGCFVGERTRSTRWWWFVLCMRCVSLACSFLCSFFCSVFVFASCIDQTFKDKIAYHQKFRIAVWHSLNVFQQCFWSLYFGKFQIEKNGTVTFEILLQLLGFQRNRNCPAEEFHFYGISYKSELRLIKQLYFLRGWKLW